LKPEKTSEKKSDKKSEKKLGVKGSDKKLAAVEGESMYSYRPIERPKPAEAPKIVRKDTWAVEKFKDALERRHVLAYATGHLSNDLVIAIWSSYSALFLNKVIMLSDYDSGLVVLMGQVIDAIFQPLISFCSDNVDTPFGKRMPWYFCGNLLTLPCFYLLFNAPDSAIGSEDHPDPAVWFFLIVPGIMNIG